MKLPNAMSNESKAAFPRSASEFTGSGSLKDGDDAIKPQSGMTLLEYYSGQALIGACASIGVDDMWTPEGMAQDCVKRAKALIAELNKDETPLTLWKFKSKS